MYVATAMLRRDIFCNAVQSAFTESSIARRHSKKRRHIEGSARHFDLPVLKCRTSAMYSFMKSHFINL
jgi:hypothetical protein